MNKYAKGELSLVNFDEDFHELSFHWINDENIMQLIDAKPISKKKQNDFLSSINLRCDYYIYGIVINGKKVGAGGIKNIKKDEGEMFCYIGELSYVGKGWGDLLIEELVNKAKELCLSRLYLKVLNNNERAIKSYQKNSFIKESEDNKFSYMYRFLK